MNKKDEKKPDILDAILGPERKPADGDEHRGSADASWEEFLEWRRSRGPDAQHRAADVLSRAVAVVALGPADAPWRSIRDVRRALTGDGVRLSPAGDPGEGPPGGWAAREVGADTLAELPVDGRQLANWVKAIHRAVEAEPRVGAVVTVSRGFIGRMMVHGDALHEASSLADAIAPGQVQVSPTVARHLSPIGVSLSSAPRRGLLRLGRPPAEPLHGQLTGVMRGLTGLSGGILDAFQDINVQVQLARALRSCQESVQIGDELRIRVGGGESTWAYGLIQGDEVLRLLDEGRPAASPERSGVMEYVVTGPPGRERPVIVAARQPLSDLDSVVAQVNAEAEGDPDQRLALLDRVLNPADQRAQVAILVGGGWEVEPDVDLSARLTALWAARDSGDRSHVITHAREMLRSGLLPVRLGIDVELALVESLRAAGLLAEAVERAECAEARAGRLGDLERMALAAAEAGLAKVMAEPMAADTDADLDRALYNAAQSGDAEIVACIRQRRSEAALSQGRPLQAEQEARAGLEGIGEGSCREALSYLLARASLARGRRAEAEAWCRLALASAVERRDEFARQRAYSLLIEINPSLAAGPA